MRSHIIIAMLTPAHPTRLMCNPGLTRRLTHVLTAHSLVAFCIPTLTVTFTVWQLYYRRDFALGYTITKRTDTTFLDFDDFYLTCGRSEVLINASLY